MAARQPADEFGRPSITQHESSSVRLAHRHFEQQIWRFHMTDKTIKLYQSAGSPNSRSVHIFTAEKKIAVTLVPVDLGAPGDVSFGPQP